MSEYLLSASVYNVLWAICEQSCPACWDNNVLRMDGRMISNYLSEGFHEKDWEVANLQTFYHKEGPC